ncbi:MAG: heat-inducible transcriptional repressor HrcA [Acutalibacteraceae bacterium]|nr:heat-inducible transcriptional repressor HrcA [Acutalibacteraceae bacterium]
MEMTERKRAILAAIVKYHIATGAPVGSKWLTTTLENAPSSATLRNEMSELSCMGLLEQPHTSAGRIPTGKGYEFYVSNLMQSDELDQSVKSFIDKALERATVDAEGLSTVAVKLLSKITGLPSFNAKISNDSAIIKKVQITPMSSRVIMLIAVTGDGRAKSKLCRTGTDISSDTLERLNKLMGEKIEGKSLMSLTAAEMQNVYAAAGIDAFSLMPLLAALFDMIREIGQPRIQFSGEANIYSMLSESERAGRLLMFLEQKEGILSIISERRDRVGVIFGTDTGFNELDRTAVIVAPWGTDSSPMGRIGVIGPTRMSYGQIVPSVAYLASRLSEIANESIKDMEEI